MEHSLVNVDPILELSFSTNIQAFGEMNVQFSYPIGKMKSDYRESIQLKYSASHQVQCICGVKESKQQCFQKSTQVLCLGLQ